MNCTASNHSQGKIEPNTTKKIDKALLPRISAYDGDIKKMLRSHPRIKSLLENAGAVYQLCIRDYWIVTSFSD